MPADSLARQMKQRCEVPPAFELYDLKNDPNEQHNLYGMADHADVEKRLKARLKFWRRQVSDPFLEDSFVKHFSEVYKKNCDLWKSLGGDKMKDKTALDFSEFIPVWDPAPYIGKKDQ